MKWMLGKINLLVDGAITGLVICFLLWAVGAHIQITF